MPGQSKTTTRLLWTVYGLLLAVLAPHTAWLFMQFEPASPWGTGAAWAGAIAFEASIAVLTHKLARHIEATPRRLSPRSRFAYQYLNAYSAGLIISVGVSALANLAHSVQFGQSLAIFAAWGIAPQVYQIAFGGILPIVSLLFARVLSNEAETDSADDPALSEALRVNTELRRQMKAAEDRTRSAEERAAAAEVRFAAAGDLFGALFAEEKRQRILAAASTWPQLSASAVAIIAGASPSYVSEVLSSQPATSEGDK